MLCCFSRQEEEEEEEEGEKKEEKKKEEEEEEEEHLARPGGGRPLLPLQPANFGLILKHQLLEADTDTNIEKKAQEVLKIEPVFDPLGPLAKFCKVF